MAPRKKTNLNFCNNARVTMKGGYVTHDVILFKKIERDDVTLHSFGDIDDALLAVNATLAAELNSRFIRFYKTYNDIFLVIKINANEIASIEEI